MNPARCFEEQGKLRALNLRQRQALAEQLGQYEQLIDSKGLDLKELDRVLTLARNDWRRFSPVDRAANKAVQAQFDAVFQRLRDRLQGEQQVFREAKLAIIEQAQALLDEPDSRQATEKSQATAARLATGRAPGTARRTGVVEVVPGDMR